MSEPKRKFLSEFALNLFSARWLMLPANQVAADAEMIERDAEISKNCHIYVLCRRPAFSFLADSFRYEDGKIKGDVVYRILGKPHSFPFSIEFPLLDGAVSLGLSPYPHREVKTRDSAGQEVRRLPASALTLPGSPNTSGDHFSDLQVLYIGQSFGDGNRTAFERVRSHSTLQKILADSSYESPDEEVFVLMFEYVEPKLITMFDGKSKEAVHGAEDERRFVSIFERPLSEQQQISLIEAGLIRYFQPRYNEIYKESFPSDSQKILRECYELDFSALIVEIDTDELGFRLKSDGVSADYHHIAQYDLHDPDERLSFFALRIDDGEVFVQPGVISPKLA